MLPRLLLNGPEKKSLKIIFLHGGPGMDHSYFHPCFTDLEKDFSCVHYTQGQHKNPSLNSLLLELETLRKKVAGKKEKVVLLGHSFGGTLALEYVRKYGEKNLLALIAIAWNYSSVLQYKFMRLPARLSRSSQVELPLEYNDAQYRQDALSAVKLYFTKDFVEEGKKIFKKSRFDAAFAQAIRHEFLDRYHGTSIIKSLKVPTLCIYGGRDKIITPSYIHYGLKLNHRIRAQKIANAGHFPFVEKPKEVCRFIKAFLFSLKTS